MDNRVFVVTHKQVDVDLPNGYEWLLVGANRYVGERRYKYQDNNGINISEKNNSYCELTGIYWVWKNCNINSNDFVGFCHYRRFFISSIVKRKFLDIKKAERILKKYDVIVPRKVYMKNNICQSVNIAPNKQDLKEIKDALQKKAPEYIGDYDWYLDNNGTYLLNMFLMKGECFNKYCNWLFPILEEIEKEHDFSNESAYRKRLVGFLSERLLNVWLRHNVSPSMIKEMYVFNTESKNQLVVAELKSIVKRISFNFSKRCKNIV